jgi:hypothetical protein
MLVVEFVIALLLGGAVVSALARRIARPYPALVGLAGAVDLSATMASGASAAS